MNRGTRGRFWSTAQQRLDESGYAAYSQNHGTRAIFSENFSSIRSVLSLVREQEQEEDETNMPPHMNPKTPPGVSKICIQEFQNFIMHSQFLQQ